MGREGATETTSPVEIVEIENDAVSTLTNSYEGFELYHQMGQASIQQESVPETPNDYDSQLVEPGQNSLSGVNASVVSPSMPSSRLQTASNLENENSNRGNPHGIIPISSIFHRAKGYFHRRRQTLEGDEDGGDGRGTQAGIERMLAATRIQAVVRSHLTQIRVLAILENKIKELTDTSKRKEGSNMDDRTVEQADKTNKQSGDSDDEATCWGNYIA